MATQAVDIRVIATLMQDLDEHVERLTTQSPAEYTTRTKRLEVKPLRS